jgi:hypothetical protein
LASLRRALAPPPRAPPGVRGAAPAAPAPPPYFALAALRAAQLAPSPEDPAARFLFTSSTREFLTRAAEPGALREAHRVLPLLLSAAAALRLGASQEHAPLLRLLVATASSRVPLGRCAASTARALVGLAALRAPAAAGTPVLLPLVQSAAALVPGAGGEGAAALLHALAQAGAGGVGGAALAPALAAAAAAAAAALPAEARAAALAALRTDFPALAARDEWRELLN